MTPYLQAINKRLLFSPFEPALNFFFSVFFPLSYPGTRGFQCFPLKGGRKVGRPKGVTAALKWTVFVYHTSAVFPENAVKIRLFRETYSAAAVYIDIAAIGAQ
jgi:hypothetical protein